MSFLTIKNIYFQFPSSPHPQFTNYSLTVSQGHCVALLGPSGCAKTTLLRLIAGINQPSQGEIWIDNQLLSGPNVFVEPEKRNIGMIFQDYALFPHITVAKNISFGLNKLNTKAQNNLVNHMLELVGITEYKNTYPHELSGGQQQRVAIVRALARKPKLLLLDEPFSNLDAHLRQTIRRDVKTILQQTKMTAILVTHDEQDANEIADHIIQLPNNPNHIAK